MSKFKVSTGISRVVEANNEDQARENFWEQIEEDNASSNTSIVVRLSENLEIKRKKDLNEIT